MEKQRFVIESLAFCCIRLLPLPRFNSMPSALSSCEIQCKRKRIMKRSQSPFVPLRSWPKSLLSTSWLMRNHCCQSVVLQCCTVYADTAAGSNKDDCSWRSNMASNKWWCAKVVGETRTVWCKAINPKFIGYCSLLNYCRATSRCTFFMTMTIWIETLIKQTQSVYFTCITLDKMVTVANDWLIH